MKNGRPSYAWLRVRWPRLVVMAAPIALVIGLISASGAMRIVVALIAWPAYVAVMLLGLLGQARRDFGSIRVLELASLTDAARQQRARRRAQAWQNAASGVQLRRIDRESIRASKELVIAVQKGDRGRFDHYFAARGFATDPAARADLAVIGMGLLALAAGRRIGYRRSPPNINHDAVLRRILGAESSFADLAFEPLAAGLLLAASPGGGPAEYVRDPVLLASEIGATTCFLVGVTTFLMDAEAENVDVEGARDSYLRQVSRKSGVKQRPVPV